MIFILKVPKDNDFIEQTESNLKFNYYIIIILGFEYKALPTKKKLYGKLIYDYELFYRVL